MDGRHAAGPCGRTGPAPWALAAAGGTAGRAGPDPAGAVVVSGGEQTGDRLAASRGMGSKQITSTSMAVYEPSADQAVCGQDRPVAACLPPPRFQQCVAQVLFPRLFKRVLDLPSATPRCELLHGRKPGAPTPFHCAMNMVRGELEVVERDAGPQEK